MQLKTFVKLIQGFWYVQHVPLKFKNFTRSSQSYNFSTTLQCWKNLVMLKFGNQHFTHIQGVSSFLPPPNFSMCQNPALDWPPPKMVEPRTCYPQKLQKSRTLVCLGVASSGLLLFSGFWHIWKLGGGKKDKTLCSYLSVSFREAAIIMSK